MRGIKTIIWSVVAVILMFIPIVIVSAGLGLILPASIRYYVVFFVGLIYGILFVGPIFFMIFQRFMEHSSYE